MRVSSSAQIQPSPCLKVLGSSSAEGQLHLAFFATRPTFWIWRKTEYSLFPGCRCQSKRGSSCKLRIRSTILADWYSRRVSQIWIENCRVHWWSTQLVSRNGLFWGLSLKSKQKLSNFGVKLSQSFSVAPIFFLVVLSIHLNLWCSLVHSCWRTKFTYLGARYTSRTALWYSTTQFIHLILETMNS